MNPLIDMLRGLVLDWREKACRSRCIADRFVGTDTGEKATHEAYVLEYAATELEDCVNSSLERKS